MTEIIGQCHCPYCDKDFEGEVTIINWENEVEDLRSDLD